MRWDKYCSDAAAAGLSLPWRIRDPCENLQRVTQQTHTHTRARLTALCPGLPGKGKTNLDFTEARDNEWQWHQLGRMYARLHLAPDRKPRQHPTPRVFTGRIPILPPNSVKALNALARWLITLRCEMLFNVRSKDDIYRTETTKQCRPKTKSKNGYAQK